MSVWWWWGGGAEGSLGHGLGLDRRKWNQPAWPGPDPNPCKITVTNPRSPIGLAGVFHKVRRLKSPYAMFCPSPLLTCSGYSSCLLACLSQHRLGLPCHFSRWYGSTMQSCAYLFRKNMFPVFVYSTAALTILRLHLIYFDGTYIWWYLLTIGCDGKMSACPKFQLLGHALIWTAFISYPMSQSQASYGYMIADFPVS